MVISSLETDNSYLYLGEIIVKGTYVNGPRFDHGRIVQKIKEMPSDDNPLRTSWSGAQTNCDHISVVNTFVNLEKVWKSFTSKCKKTETLNIKADIIIIPNDLEFTGLKKLTIKSNQLWVQNSASKLSFKQSAQSNSDDAGKAVHDGKNGDDGLGGENGTEVMIQARDLYTEGPFVVQVEGGKGGNGGKGSDGKKGNDGANATQNPLWESEGWPDAFKSYGGAEELEGWNNVNK